MQYGHSNSLTILFLIILPLVACLVTLVIVGGGR